MVIDGGLGVYFGRTKNNKTILYCQITCKEWFYQL